MNVLTSRSSFVLFLALAATLWMYLPVSAIANSTGSPVCSTTPSQMDAVDLTATVISPNGWSIGVPLSYTSGTPLTVAIANTNPGKQFRGLLLWATNAGGMLVGAWTVPAGYAAPSACGGSSLTHTSSTGKSQRSFSFTPPPAGSGTITFRAVVTEECGAGSCRSAHAFPNAIAVTESLYTLTVARTGDGTGTVIYNPSGIQCGAVCTADFVANQSVTLLALPAANSVFTAWLDCDSNASDQCTVGMNRNRTATAVFREARMDVDGSGLPTRYEAATDGVLLMRYLLGLRGAALTSGALAGGATRDAAQVAAYLAARIASLDVDVDADGTVRATSDGVLIIRYMLGLRGAVLTAGANAGTLTTPQIEAALETLMPLPAQ